MTATGKGYLRVAAKCAPDPAILDAVGESGIRCVELYTSAAILADTGRAVAQARRYPFQYAVHAPTDGSALHEVFDLAAGVAAEILVMHNIYWEDEWRWIAEQSGRTGIPVCVENISNTEDIIRVLRRFGFRRCLDFEHYILGTNGLHLQYFPSILPQCGHVHMTGYMFGSEGWHTQLHHAPLQSTTLLDILAYGGYSGMIVSEADVVHQTREEFKQLYEFFSNWQKNCGT